MMELLRQLRDLLTQNIGLKVVSLLLAVLIHIVVQRDSVREVSVDVPVTLANVPENQVFVGTLPDSIKLRVRGRWGPLRELLANRNARVVVDLRQYRNGERYVFEAHDVEQQLPTRHVEVLSVQPSAFEVELEPIANKLVPVEVSVTGEPAPGYRVTPRSLSVEPRQVTVSGPKADVRKVQSVRAAAVELGGTAQDLRAVTRLLPPAGQHLRLSIDEVVVTVELEQQEVTRRLESQPVVVRGCPAERRCELEPAAVDVQVKGLVRAVEAFLARPPDNLVYADLGPALTRGERKVRLNVNEVEGLELAPVPAVAKFSVLGEIPPPAADPGP